MSYKDLLVHVDESKSCVKRIEAAIRLADAHDAQLTGVCVMPEPSAFAYAVHLPAEVLETLSREATERAESVLKGFAGAAERAGIAYATRMDRGVDVELPEILAVHARHADLIVLGQVDADDPAVRHRSLPEEVTLNSGRPTLIVPYIGAAATVGERVTVAWNASREAARAVGDAMPLLERAKAVTVVSVNPRFDRFGHGEQPGADIAVHLAKHGVKVEVERLEATDIDVPNAILSRLADSGSDLLVMGCYGHSRLREMVLGGVTRTILHDMTVPVLMAH
ncbi:MAG: universal stress protein [Geminicoccales bacterium]